MTTTSTSGRASQPHPGNQPPERRVRSAAGVEAQFTAAAQLRRLDAGGRSILMYPADDVESGPANLYLRAHGRDGIEAAALLGPASAGVVTWTAAGPDVVGRWRDLTYRVRFRLAERAAAWFWHVEVTNDGAAAVTVDVVHTQDVALTPYAALRTNEYYAAQYLDLSPVAVGGGTALAVRQNMPGVSAPWVVLGSLRGAVGWGTDALQLTGRDLPGGGGVPLGLLAERLPSRRLQHEHTLAMLQDRPLELAPGESRSTGFFGHYRADHPAATAPADAAAVDAVLALAEARPPERGAAGPGGAPVVGSLFATAPTLAPLPLDATTLTALAGPGRHHVETADAELLAYFTADGTHVVTAAKERRVLRPHGHILRTGTALVPDESSLTSTAWLAGVFASQLTQGHASRDPVLSVRRGYLGLRRAYGLRIFADLGAGWTLLDVPSAWAQAPDACRWWYRHAGGLLEVETVVAAESHAVRVRLRVVAGPPARVLVAAHVAFGGDDGADPVPPVLAVDGAGVTVGVPVGAELAARSPGASFRLAWGDRGDSGDSGDDDGDGAAVAVGRDEALFADGASRDLPWLTLTTGPRLRLDLTLTLDLARSPDLATAVAATPPPAPWPEFWAGLGASIRLRAPAGSPLATEVAQLDAVLPSFAHDAVIHYLAPRGLEQFTGGAWGTRDACQGPVGLLVALGQPAPLRDLVLRILRAQHARGDWPQWFEFWDRATPTTSPGAHGDVVYWPLLAVGEYLAMTGDASLLAEAVPFVGDDGRTAAEPVLEHLRRALAHIRATTVPGSPLPAYGHGDWNDSLQPVDTQLAARLCSTWTVTLQVHALRTLAGALRGLAGAHAPAEAAGRAWAAGRDWAADAEAIADRSAAALDTTLVRDGLLCGYGLFGADGTVEHLVHPSDTRTGLHHSLLPTIHAISGDLLSPESARTHLAALEANLLGPDGARLFDRPARYQGGPLEVFQRAEAATFFGREIGVMYTHAHLRYAEALARHGDADALLPALLLADPIGLTERVPAAAPRQSTAYFSSSDAVFADRYDAAEHYDRIGRGEVALEGGWRVYSSGPGLFLRLVVESLLGVRRRGALLELDPVLTGSLDGLTATVPLDGRALQLTYAVGPRGCGPTAVFLDGIELQTTALANPYRAAGVAVELEPVLAALRAGRGALRVEVG
ncbi:GH36-type glycosyl hydrolase domain-containing protein [Pengzhenrongella sicca]|uniref:Cellobiose phosphorylase n=1 Tax=Pengzhenrongella sicca TaxID=2819238 RepID=A0A8A4ZCY3_9MICO|nr:cellobiose phosphorylase [Pengzhenrongella sicca]QTE29281.1 cellobiose phosphorylase [Pengzhenrongella sicca]